MSAQICQNSTYLSLVSRPLQHQRVLLINKGVNLFGTTTSRPIDRPIPTRTETTTAFCLYTVLFGPGTFLDNLAPIHDLYTKVLQHRYGGRASEVHPFILQDRNPLHLLIQINVILLGSPVISAKLVGRVRYLQKVRAICAIVSFERLGRAIEGCRLSLETQSRQRRETLVVQAALLLDQVIQMSGDIPSAAISYAQGAMFNETRHQLIQFLSYYLHKLVPSRRGSLLNCINEAKCQGYLGDIFWRILSDPYPQLRLQKPPVLLKYAHMNWKTFDEESDEGLSEFFLSRCSIRCN